MKTKVNEIQISYHGNQTINTTFKIGCSQDAAKLAFEHWDQNHIEMQEHFKILLLNNSNIVKGIYEVSKGGITGTLVDLRILFAVVLKSLPTAIILLHYLKKIIMLKYAFRLNILFEVQQFRLKIKVH